MQNDQNQEQREPNQEPQRREISFGKVLLGAVVLGGLATGGYLLKNKIFGDKKAPVNNSTAQAQTNSPATSTNQLAYAQTNSPNHYSSIRNTEAPNFSLDNKTKHLSMNIITRNGENFIVETNRYPMPNELNWMLRDLSETSLDTDGQSIVNAEGVAYIPTLITNQYGMPSKGLKLTKAGPHNIDLTRKVIPSKSVSGDTNYTLSSKLEVKLNRELLNWNIGGTNYYLPGSIEGVLSATGFYATPKGAEKYTPEGNLVIGNETIYRFNPISGQDYHLRAAKKNTNSINNLPINPPVAGEGSLLEK